MLGSQKHTTAPVHKQHATQWEAARLTGNTISCRIKSGSERVSAFDAGLLASATAVST